MITNRGDLDLKIGLRRAWGQLRATFSAQGERGTRNRQALQDLPSIPFFGHESYSKTSPPGQDNRKDNTQIG